MKSLSAFCGAVASAFVMVTPAASQEAADLAKELANPLANLINVPVQFNYDRGYGPTDDGSRVVVNIQPVIPVSISEDWNLISRTIVPIVWQDDLFPGAGSQFGLGDVVQSAFFSPAKVGESGVIWGVGPVFLLPTATDNATGSGKWGAGPTTVVLKQSGQWTYGALGNHIWSFAGEGGRRDVNSTLVQPFISYATPGGTSFSLQSEFTYDWETEQAAIPINASVAQVLNLGGQNIQVSAGLRYWLGSPAGGPEGFGGRLSVSFLFPN